MKRQGLNSQNVRWFVDGLNIGTRKMEDVYTDFGNAKVTYQNLLSENANLRNENQNLTSENQEVVRQIEDNRRVFENKSKAMKQYISDLSKVQKQQEQNVNMLSDRIAKAIQ